LWNWIQAKEEYILEGLPPVTALQTAHVAGLNVFFSGHNNGFVMVSNVDVYVHT
jgi:hypothetical protein